MKLRAMVFAGDPEAVSFLNTTEEFGLRIDYGQNKGRKRVFCRTLRTIKCIPYNDLTCLFVKSRTAVIVNPAAQMTRSTVLPKA